MQTLVGGGMSKSVMTKQEIDIDGEKYLLKVHIERRRDVSATLRGGNINVRLPAYLGKKDRARHIALAIEDLSKYIRQNPGLKPKPKSIRKFSDGEILKAGPDEYILEIRRNNSRQSAAKLHGNVIRLSFAEGMDEAEACRHAEYLIGRCIAKKRHPEITALVQELNDKHFQKEIKSVRLKNNSSNWGSCSKTGNINLSTRLLLAPRDVLEYVIVHELAHLAEMNHSPKFWALVEQAVPDYKKKRQWLNKHGEELSF